MSAEAYLCVCYTACFSLCVDDTFLALCASVVSCVFVSKCVPAALHPCRHANLLAASHSLYPEKEVLSRWQCHDAPLPIQC